MKEIVYTAHALEKFAERGLSLEWIERAMLRPDYTRPDPVQPAVQAFKAIPERDSRVIRVVYVEEEEVVRVITAFFDRRAGR